MSTTSTDNRIAALYVSLAMSPIVMGFVDKWRNLVNPVKPEQTVMVVDEPKLAVRYDTFGAPRRGFFQVPNSRREVWSFHDQSGREVEVPVRDIPQLSPGDFVKVSEMKRGLMGAVSNVEASKANLTETEE